MPSNFTKYLFLFIYIVSFDLVFCEKIIASFKSHYEALAYFIKIEDKSFYYIRRNRNKYDLIYDEYFGKLDPDEAKKDSLLRENPGYGLYQKLAEIDQDLTNYAVSNKIITLPKKEVVKKEITAVLAVDTLTALERIARLKKELQAIDNLYSEYQKDIYFKSHCKWDSLSIDAQKLRKLGFEKLTDKTIYLAALIIAYETGIYNFGDGYQNMIIRQKNEMKDISLVIANRYLLSHYRADFRKIFTKKREATIANILTANKQFSFYNPKEIRAKIAEGLKKKDLFYLAESKSDSTRIAMAREIFVETLANYANDRYFDENGNAFYKNTDFVNKERAEQGKAPLVWSNKNISGGNYYLKKSKQQYDHSFYHLRARKGDYNLAKLAYDNFFGEKKN